MSTRPYWLIASLIVFGVVASALPTDSPGSPAGVWAAEDEPASDDKAAESADDAAAPKTPEEKASEPQADSDSEQEYYELFELLADTLDQIERNYVKDIDRRDLMEAAIRGMLTELDPYSNYVEPERVERFRSEVENEFAGVGIQVSVEGGQLKVLSPLVGSPAYEAGLLAGDVILSIDGKSAEGITIDEAVRRVKGPIGSSVTMEVLHPGAMDSQEITVKRGLVVVETVRSDSRNSDQTWDWLFDDDLKIGYIRITSFGRRTAKELQAALQKLKEDDARGLILDLRFNPGGLLSSAIEVSDLFISEGRIVSTEGRNVQPRRWNARQRGTFGELPLVILVNRYSASASEIVAACLQDHGRAAIIGERTWGKGSVQNVIELEGGGSALKLTTASYHRPSGKNIHRYPNMEEDDEWGVQPNEGLEIRLSTAQMRRLAEQRREKDIVRNHQTGDTAEQASNPEEPQDADQAPEDAASSIDLQLDKALEYLREQIRAEPAAEPESQDEPPVAEAA
jgi:carboxyl-terminal processing protease